MKCIECGYETEKKLTKHVAELEHCVLIIKDVPAHVCPHCGEVYYDNDVAGKLEKIVTQFEGFIQEVAIIEFDKVA